MFMWERLTRELLFTAVSDTRLQILHLDLDFLIVS